MTINAHIRFWFGQFKTQFNVAISDQVSCRLGQVEGKFIVAISDIVGSR